MIKKSFLFAFCIVLFVACSDNNISIVKKGTMKFDETITIGDAIDNYKYCQSKPKWESFITDNKREIVQVTCDISKQYQDELQNIIDQNKQMMIELENKIRSIPDKITQYTKELNEKESRSKILNNEILQIEAANDKVRKNMNKIDEKRAEITKRTNKIIDERTKTEIQAYKNELKQKIEQEIEKKKQAGGGKELSLQEKFALNRDIENLRGKFYNVSVTNQMSQKIQQQELLAIQPELEKLQRDYDQERTKIINSFDMNTKYSNLNTLQRDISNLKSKISNEELSIKSYQEQYDETKRDLDDNILRLKSAKRNLLIQFAISKASVNSFEMSYIGIEQNNKIDGKNEIGLDFYILKNIFKNIHY